MRYAVITAILVLGLTGCNLNGVTFDTSTLPNLNIDEVNCNNCNVNVNTVDDDMQSVKHFYYVWEVDSDSSGVNPKGYVVTLGMQQGTFYGAFGNFFSDEEPRSSLHEWAHGTKESTDKAYNNPLSRLDVDGDLGLFVEYNYNPATYDETEGLGEYYIVSGGNIEQNYTTMPSGTYQYNGKVVTTSEKIHEPIEIEVGTATAEVNFTDETMWLELEDIGRFEDMRIKMEEGEFRSNNAEIDGTSTKVYGRFIGREAKGLTGHIWQLDEPDITGVFAAERSDTQVVAEN